MAKYLVRVEAVNFDNFIFDSSDLSTIRGGGLLLLNAAKALRTAEAFGPFKLECVFTGASTGLFTAEVDGGPDTVAAFCEKLRKTLQSDECADSTFVVDAQPYREGQFQDDHALVTASNRWSQMRSPALVLPPPAAGPCAIDRIRPAPERMRRKGAAFLPQAEDEWMCVSTATRTRREEGILLKRKLYRDIYQRARGAESPYQAFTNDTEEIADYPAAGKLHRKIALIYLDGNGFGSILRACADPERAKKWSELQEDNQDRFLAWLLSIPGQLEEAEGKRRRGEDDRTPWLWSGPVVDNNNRKIRKQDAFRLETLLWGGDEIAWVAPAWTGWWMLEKFFACYGKLAATPQYSFDPDEKGPRRLTHSAGIVFCHHDAPLPRVIELAKKLADRPKDLIRKGQNYRNYFAYQILESFDHLGDDPKSARKALVQDLESGADDALLLLDGGDMAEMHRNIATLKLSVPRSVLFEVVARIYRDHQPAAGFADLRKPIKRGAANSADVSAAFENLHRLATAAAPGASKEVKDAIALLHLAELWDYIQPAAWQSPVWECVGGRQ